MQRWPLILQKNSVFRAKKINDLRAYLAELSIAKSPYGKNDEKTEQASSHKKQTTRKVVEK